MSVDPAAVSASSGVSAAALDALVQAEFQQLAADAEALANAVTTGQVVTATVLPPSGGTDLISVLGNRVAASLPPTLVPGDTFTAQVTGFDGTQILLQMLSSIEPPDISSGPPPGLTSAPAPSIASTPLQAAAAGPPLPAGVSQSVAPPPAVFVAASVRPAAPPPGAPFAAPPSAQAVQLQPALLGDIEARLAAARAGQVAINVPTGPAPSAPPPQSPVGLNSSPPPPLPTPPQAGQQPAGAAQLPPPSIAGRYALPPNIVPSTRFGAAAPAATAAPAGEAAPAPAGLAAFRDPTALVRALGLPNTPTNVAAAKLALDTPQRLPAALATLESALPQTDDPRVATLRTLTAWIGKIDPASPQLASQISSFIDNVVTGNEPKLVQLLTAQLIADQPGTTTAAEAAASATTQGGEPVGPGATAPTFPTLALAQLAERGAALGVDLKTQLLSIINAPPTGAAADLVPAAATALSAVTAVQLNAAQAMNAAPQTMAFTIPMWLGSGYAQARVSIDRDAPEGTASKSLDGDNFHIAFVLDTKHLGTVTVDLQTVGRAFSLAVRTENEKSAKTFGDHLPRLTDRLETLRYRVNSAEAGVAPRGTGAAGAATPAVASAAADAALDRVTATDVNARA
jgi:hypothetical protein